LVGRHRLVGGSRLAAARKGYPAGFDLYTYFLHDVDPDVAAEGEPYQREESDAIFESVCGFDEWPRVPIHVVAGADDRFFRSSSSNASLANDLGIEADVLPGGHCLALSQAPALAEYLLAV